MDHASLIDTRGAAHEHAISKRIPSKQQAKVLACLGFEGACTRTELHQKTGISVTSLCARIKELLDSDSIRVVKQVTCPVSGRVVNSYNLKAPQ